MSADHPAQHQTPSRVSLSTWSKFHFFQLARHLYSAGMLHQVFTNLPRYWVSNEGIPASHIETNPFPALLNYGFKRFQIPFPVALEHSLAWTIDSSQQRFVARRLHDCDVFVALSGSGLSGGRLTKQRGGRYICERASTHMVWQRDTLTEEFKRFGLPAPFFDERMIDKELAEYQECDALVVPSQFVRQSFVEHGIDPNKIFVIRYGVDLSIFGKEKIDRSDDEFRVTWVGQVSLRKGIPYLLEAFAKLRHPRKRLMIAGAMHGEMRKLLKTLPHDQVEFLGVMDKASLRNLYNSCDAFCIASIEEGLAYVIPEALACGLPVVATHSSGAVDMITDGIEGFIVPARSPALMTERLQQLADNVDLQRRMGEAALARAKKLRGWNEHGEQYRNLISELVARRERGTSASDQLAP